MHLGQAPLKELATDVAACNPPQVTDAGHIRELAETRAFVYLV